MTNPAPGSSKGKDMTEIRNNYHKPVNMPPEQLMFQKVIRQAFIDAVTGASISKREQDKAHRWLVNCGLDFRFICSMAGIDAGFLSEKYRQGKIDKNAFYNKRKGCILGGMSN